MAPKAKLPRSEIADRPKCTEQEFSDWRDGTDSADHKFHYEKPWKENADEEKMAQLKDFDSKGRRKKVVEDPVRKAQAEKILHCFTIYDADNSESLDIRELGKILVECGMKRDAAEKLFKLIDKDGNKHISHKEFINWIFEYKDDGGDETDKLAQRKLAQRAVRPIKPKEAVIDFLEYLNKLGDDEDFAANCEEVFKTRKLELENGAGGTLVLKDLFKYMDANKNGKVSFAEFKSALATMGFQMDTKLAQGVFRLMDTAKQHPKKLVDKEGKPVTMKDGVLDYAEFEKCLTEGISEE